MSRDRSARGPGLFAPGELMLKPSAPVRLRELAARAPRTSVRPSRIEEDRHVMGALREFGTDLARRFGLRYRALDPERDGVVAHYGICYEDGLIRIRLRHAKTGRLLKQSSLVDTLCHELAHLQHMDHSIRFRRLYARILEQARRLGYYRPGPAGDPKPRQLDLFEPGACGTAGASDRGRSRHARPV